MRRLIALLALAPIAVLPGPGRLLAAPSTAGEAAYLNPDLVAVDRVPGTILDVSDRYILFRDGSASPPRLRMKDRASGGVTELPAAPERRHDRGWLIPGGALFSALGETVLTERFYEWSNGRGLTDLGPLTSATSPAVAGAFVIWNDASTLYRRNVTTGETVTVATGAGNVNNDVEPGGDVVYWTSRTYQVHRFRDGVTEQLTHDPDRWNTYPVTDGTNVVYRKSRPVGCCSDQFVFWLYDGHEEIPLSPPTDYTPDPPAQYDVAGGWTAFTQWSEGPLAQVWLRDPEGAIRQVSDLLGPLSRITRIHGLSPSGQVVYSLDGTVYLGVPGRPPVRLAAGVGDWAAGRADDLPNRVVALNGTWLVAIDGTLYRLADHRAVAPTVTRQPADARVIAVPA